MGRFLQVLGIAAGLALASVSAHAADLLDPTPVAQQGPEPAVDGINYKLSILGGSLQRNVLGNASNAMFVGSVAMPIPNMPSYGAQLDLGAGVYDGSFTSAVAGLHLFWRDPSQGLLGIYGDWAYTNPEHGGRVGIEASVYRDRYTLDVLAGIQFGQHLYTRFVDEVDLGYYFTDNFRASIGHRLTSRGHVGNLSFEYMFENASVNGLSVFGEVEGGQDNYVGAWGGIRYSFGTGSWTTLIDRDRRGDPIVRVPRNLVSVSQCGDLDVPKPATFWRSEMSNLCASEDEINAVSTPGITKK